MKKISIIIPVYNSEEFLNKCLDSILSQSMIDDVEVILINDGSKDDSLSILKIYEQKFPKIIKVIDQENMGVSKTRNKGIDIATGKYIMFIDNDDYIEKDYIEKFYNEIQKRKLDILIGGYKRVTDEKILFEKSIKDKIDIYSQLAPWAKIYKKKFLLQNNIKFFSHPIGEDVYFSLKIYNSTSKIDCFDYNGYNWYYNNKSVSNNKQKKGNKDLKVIDLLNKIYKEINLNEINEYFFIRYFVWFSLFTIKDTCNDIYIENYITIKNWLYTNCPKFKKNNYLKFKNNSDKKTLFIIKIIILLQTIKIDRLLMNFVNKYIFKN